jgi:hypothetical protein
MLLLAVAAHPLAVRLRAGSTGAGRRVSLEKAHTRDVHQAIHETGFPIHYEFRAPEEHDRLLLRSCSPALASLRSLQDTLKILREPGPDKSCHKAGKLLLWHLLGQRLRVAPKPEPLGSVQGAFVGERV